VVADARRLRRLDEEPRVRRGALEPAAEGNVRGTERPRGARDPHQHRSRPRLSRVPTDERPEGVVALSRWRAVLARSRNPRKRVDLLLADPQAAAIVPRIPVEE